METPDVAKAVSKVRDETTIVGKHLNEKVFDPIKNAYGKKETPAYTEAVTAVIQALVQLAGEDNKSVLAARLKIVKPCFQRMIEDIEYDGEELDFPSTGNCCEGIKTTAGNNLIDQCEKFLKTSQHFAQVTWEAFDRDEDKHRKFMKEVQNVMFRETYRIMATAFKAVGAIAALAIVASAVHAAATGPKDMSIANRLKKYYTDMGQAASSWFSKVKKGGATSLMRRTKDAAKAIKAEDPSSLLKAEGPSSLLKAYDDATKGGAPSLAKEVSLADKQWKRDMKKHVKAKKGWSTRDMIGVGAGVGAGVATLGGVAYKYKDLIKIKFLARKVDQAKITSETAQADKIVVDVALSKAQADNAKDTEIKTLVEKAATAKERALKAEVALEAAIKALNDAKVKAEAPKDEVKTPPPVEKSSSSP